VIYRQLERATHSGSERRGMLSLFGGHSSRAIPSTDCMTEPMTTTQRQTLGNIDSSSSPKPSPRCFTSRGGVLHYT
jgi:hypothetical protein